MTSVVPWLVPASVPEPQRHRGRTGLRYEDIAQDGRVKLVSLAHALGPGIWQKIGEHAPLREAMRQGIIPVLTRLVVEGGVDPVPVERPLEVEGAYQLAHTVDEAGQVNRLLLNLGVEVHGRIGRTNLPPPARDGEPTRVGRVFAEHVFSRLFAPPGERKVLRFELGGLEPVPPQRYDWTAPDRLLEVPAGARVLDDELVAGPAHLFGLCHSDSNQHVNSLVYPRLFEEAALLQLAAHGIAPGLLGHRLEVAYRKPAFVGQRARIYLRTFVDGESPGAVGLFLPEEAGADAPAPAGRALCYLALRLG